MLDNNVAFIDVDRDAFRVWRGMERDKLIEFADAFIPDAVLVIWKVRTHDLTLSQLTAREQVEHALISSGSWHILTPDEVIQFLEQVPRG